MTAAAIAKAQRKLSVYLPAGAEPTVPPGRSAGAVARRRISFTANSSESRSSVARFSPDSCSIRSRRWRNVLGGCRAPAPSSRCCAGRAGSARASSRAACAAARRIRRAGARPPPGRRPGCPGAAADEVLVRAEALVCSAPPSGISAPAISAASAASRRLWAPSATPGAGRCADHQLLADTEVPQRLVELRKLTGARRARQ